MTLFADRNDIKPMLRLVTKMMMVFDSRLYTIRALLVFCFGQLSHFNCKMNACAGFVLQGMANSIFLGCKAMRLFVFGGLGCKAMRLFVFGGLMIDFAIRLAFGAVFIAQHCHFAFVAMVISIASLLIIAARFAITSKAIFAASVFVKLRSWKISIAVRTAFCFNWFRHSFSFIKVMFKRIAPPIGAFRFLNSTAFSCQSKGVI